jgi:hypothetical protein
MGDLDSPELVREDDAGRRIREDAKAVLLKDLQRIVDECISTPVGDVWDFSITRDDVVVVWKVLMGLHIPTNVVKDAFEDVGINVNEVVLLKDKDDGEWYYHIEYTAFDHCTYFWRREQARNQAQQPLPCATAVMDAVAYDALLTDDPERGRGPRMESSVSEESRCDPAWLTHPADRIVQAFFQEDENKSPKSTTFLKCCVIS